MQMNKTLKLLPLGLVAMFSLSVVPAVVTQANAWQDYPSYYVNFYNNYLREDFTLSSGFVGKGNNLLYKSLFVEHDSLVTKPEDPVRKNYDFVGWYKETECENEWLFDTDKVTSDVRLYAKWEYASSGDDKEPEYTPPSTVLDEDAEFDYQLRSIMGFEVSDLDSVKMPTVALQRLADNKDNVLPLMEYRVKASKSFTATYTPSSPNGFITITCNEEVRKISVINGAADYHMNTTDYENKATKYENKYETEENESYHVLLAGSSSIEFWETSKEDMNPVVTYNHGIGGTTVEDWTDKLNQRLVYPYKPKLVTYYVGINNIVNAGKTAQETLDALTTFFDKTHKDLPDAQIQYVLLNLVPGFPAKYQAIKDVNKGVVEYQEEHSEWLTLINPGDKLLKENGEPNAAYFRMDGLHLTYYGYTIWGGIIKESIIEGLKRL